MSQAYEEFFTRRELKPGQVSSIRLFELATLSSREIYATGDGVIGTANWTRADDLVFNLDGHIYAMPAAGGTPRLIDFGRGDLNHDHTLAPDGAHIFLSTNDCDLLLGSLAGGQPERLTDDADGLAARYAHGISPDGTTLLFTGGPTVGWLVPYHIYGLDLATRKTRQLTPDGPYRDDGAEYTPDGQWIYFSSERNSTLPGHCQIFRMRPNGSDIEQVTHDARVNWFPHPSPDGKHLVYLSYEPLVVGHPFHQFVELVLLRLPDHAEITRFEVFGGNGSLSEASWSPDSTSFTYTEYELGRLQNMERT